MSKDNGGNGVDKPMKCNFCQRSQHDVLKLIAGPNVFICDNCVGLCNEIIREEQDGSDETGARNLPTPEEVKDMLDEYVVGQDWNREVLSVSVNNRSSQLISSRKKDAGALQQNILVITISSEKEKV